MAIMPCCWFGIIRPPMGCCCCMPPIGCCCCMGFCIGFCI